MYQCICAEGFVLMLTNVILVIVITPRLVFTAVKIPSELSTPWPVGLTLLIHVGPPRYILASLPNCLAIDLHRLQDASYLLHAFHIIGSVVVRI